MNSIQPGQYRNTAIALKTRVYLSMQNYGAVVTRRKQTGRQAAGSVQSNERWRSGFTATKITTIFGAALVLQYNRVYLPMTSTYWR